MSSAGKSCAAGHRSILPSSASCSDGAAVAPEAPPAAALQHKSPMLLKHIGTEKLLYVVRNVGLQVVQWPVAHLESSWSRIPPAAASSSDSASSAAPT